MLTWTANKQIFAARMHLWELAELTEGDQGRSSRQAMTRRYLSLKG
jgi:hypothetical protein